MSRRIKSSHGGDKSSQLRGNNNEAGERDSSDTENTYSQSGYPAIPESVKSSEDVSVKPKAKHISVRKHGNTNSNKTNDESSQKPSDFDKRLEKTDRAIKWFTGVSTASAVISATIASLTYCSLDSTSKQTERAIAQIGNTAVAAQKQSDAIQKETVAINVGADNTARVAVGANNTAKQLKTANDIAQSNLRNALRQLKAAQLVANSAVEANRIVAIKSLPSPALIKAQIEYAGDGIRPTISWTIGNFGQTGVIGMLNTCDVNILPWPLWNADVFANDQAGRSEENEIIVESVTTKTSPISSIAGGESIDQGMIWWRELTQSDVSRISSGKYAMFLNCHGTYQDGYGHTRKFWGQAYYNRILNTRSPNIMTIHRSDHE